MERTPPLNMKYRINCTKCNKPKGWSASRTTKRSCMKCVDSKTIKESKEKIYGKK